MTVPQFPDSDAELDAGEPTELVERAFGHENRRRLLSRYLAGQDDLSAATAWMHVYRLLLWVDPTIGLAHCYESDKCQPGRPWYGRSLAFHVWLASAFSLSPLELGKGIDNLFTWAISDLAAYAASRRERYAAAAGIQRLAHAPADLPIPGEDPELVEIVQRHLGPWFSAPPDPEALRLLAAGVRLHVGQENKRKNLVGEGFEDTLAAILSRMPAITSAHDIHVRPKLHELPGFHEPRDDGTALQVDLALVRRSDNHRTLVTCKWSFRSDREKQFPNEYAAYTELRSTDRPFDYVLLTNEFDPARLASVCDRRHGLHPLFQSVVHVNPDGPLAAYQYGQERERMSRGIARATQHVADGRIVGLEAWLDYLRGGPRALDSAPARRRPARA